MRYVYPLLIFAGIFLLIVPTVVPVLKTSADFCMLSTNWNGCSQFAKVLAERGNIVWIINPYNTLDLDENGVLIVVGPDVDFSSLEIKAVSNFLNRGGTLLLADDFGTANTLIAGLEIDWKFYDRPLGDIFYDKRADFPVVARIEDPGLAYNVEKLVLNVPSVITGSEGEAFSSKVSVVGGKRRSYPIMAETSYGEGRVILLSDPDIVINDMMTENRNFVENLVAYLGSDLFYFDDAHHPDFNPYLITTVYVHRELDREKAFMVFTFVAALLLFIEGGIAGIIVRAIGRLMPAHRGGDIYEDLPEGIDIKTIKRIVNEIQTGTKFGDSYEQGRKGKGIYRAAKRGSQ
jgi:hypothetical protein